MNKELKGANGYIVGENRYFCNLNSTTILNAIMTNTQKEKCDYYDAIKNVMKNVDNVFNIVYNDIKNNAGVIRYTNKNDRINLATLIHEFQVIGTTFRFSFSSKGNDCIRLLYLDDRLTKLESDQSKIESAREELRKLYSDSKIIEVINEVNKRTVDYVLKSDTLFGQFYKKHSNLDKVFFKDLYEYINYKNNPNKYMTRSGYSLFNSNYLNYLQKQVLGSTYSVNNNISFGKTIKTEIEKVIKTLSNDLEKGDSYNDYLTDYNFATVCEKNKEFARVNVYGSNIKQLAEKLHWYVPVDVNLVRRLQQGFNKYIYNFQINEDGILSKKMIYEMIRFHKKINDGEIFEVKKSRFTSTLHKSSFLELINNSEHIILNNKHHFITKDLLNILVIFNKVVESYDALSSSTERKLKMIFWHSVLLSPSELMGLEMTDILSAYGVKRGLSIGSKVGQKIGNGVAVAIGGAVGTIGGYTLGYKAGEAITDNLDELIYKTAYVYIIYCGIEIKSNLYFKEFAILNTSLVIILLEQFTDFMITQMIQQMTDSDGYFDTNGLLLP